MTEVQLISAAWCKRCHTLKPDIAAATTVAGASFAIIDYDTLDETDPVRNAVTALPMIRMRTGPDAPWAAYTPAELDVWKADLMATVKIATNSLDF
jgi:hypothetical protein